MHLYLAGTIWYQANDWSSLHARMPKRLYAFTDWKELPDWAATHEPDTARLIIDSGAFGVWTQGKTITADDYGDWATRVQNEYGPRMRDLLFINLDVIPGTRDTPPTTRDRERAMSQSLDNADTLRSRGLDIAEVFHQGEPMTFLDTLVQRLPPGGRLCIAPDKGTSVSARTKWMKACLAHLLASFTPATLPRCHGLGVSGRTQLLAFPWYSTDASSWTSPVRYGQSHAARLPYVPAWKGGQGRAAITYALRREAKACHDLEAEITAIWRARGVCWRD